MLSSAHVDAVTEWLFGAAAVFLPRLVEALLILIVGTFLASWIARGVSAALDETGRIDETARPAMASAARYAVLIVAFIAALSQLGVQTASLLAALGAAGLAIGLALQGTLSNIAAGLMLLWLRPFRIGDYLEVISGAPFAGTVREIGLFASQLQTYDGLFVFAPNSQLWSVPLRNHSRNAGRLIVFSVVLEPGADVDRARDLLLAAMREEPLALQTPEPSVFLEKLDAGAATLICRMWATHAGVGGVQRAFADEAHRRLQAAGESLKPRQILRLVPPDADPTRFVS